ncbi:MAG: hypothetical protein V4520_02080 [Bacteroidota bacterium]
MNPKTSIGIRSSPTCIYYAVVQESDDSIEILAIDKLVVPTALLIPEQLKFIRHNLLDILNEFEVNLACIRVTEANAQSINRFRISIEAVIQELLASSIVSHYFSGQISSISAKLGFDRTLFKPFIEGQKVFSDLPNWLTQKTEHREALLSAFSALNLK